MNRNNVGMMFFDFFCNIHARVGYERNLGQKFIFLFLGLSQPDLDRNIAVIMFLKFLNCFANFFWNILDRVGKERNSGLKFFSLSFSFYLTPVWIKIMLEWYFLIFWFFLQYSCQGWVGTEFGTKIYFSLSRPISARFG